MTQDRATTSPAEDSDPLQTETVVGQADVNSASGQKRRDAHHAALDAREKGDLDRLFAAYRTAVEERAESEDMWLKTMCHLSGKPLAVLTQANPTEAIRDVALAAIQLAKEVALHGASPLTGDPQNE